MGFIAITNNTYADVILIGNISCFVRHRCPILLLLLIVALELLSRMIIKAFKRKQLLGVQFCEEGLLGVSIFF
jgi:hypothetical protein